MHKLYRKTSINNFLFLNDLKWTLFLEVYIIIIFWWISIFSFLTFVLKKCLIKLLFTCTWLVHYSPHYPHSINDTIINYHFNITKWTYMECFICHKWVTLPPINSVCCLCSSKWTTFWIHLLLQAFHFAMPMIDVIPCLIVHHALLSL